MNDESNIFNEKVNDLSNTLAIMAVCNPFYANKPIDEIAFDVRIKWVHKNISAVEIDFIQERFELIKAGIIKCCNSDD